MKIHTIKRIFYVLALTLAMVGFSFLGQARAQDNRIFVIADMVNPQGDALIQEYSFSGGPPVFTLINQNTKSIPADGYAAVGITMDEVNEILFITFELSGQIGLMDGALTDLGFATIVGGTGGNLAGVVYNHDNRRLYAIDRDTGVLYVWAWDSFTNTLTLQSTHELEGITPPAYGLDLFDGVLLVSDGTNLIRVYLTSDFSLDQTITVGNDAVGMGLNALSGYLYYGGEFVGNTLLTRTDFIGTEISVDLTPDGAEGVAVDKITGNVFCTTGSSNDELRAFAYDLTPLDAVTLGDEPTGLYITRDPFNFTKTRLDSTYDPVGRDCVEPGEVITYEIFFRNTMLIPLIYYIIDQLPPETTFISASNGGVYDSSTHSVSWDFLAVDPDDEVRAQVSVQVKPCVEPGAVLYNVVDYMVYEGTTLIFENEVFNTAFVCQCPCPVAMATVKSEVEQTSWEGAQVLLDGSRSESVPPDPAWPITYTWSIENTDTGKVSTVEGQKPLVLLARGSYEITLEVSQWCDYCQVINPIKWCSDTYVVTTEVVDTTPPMIQCPPDIKVEQADRSGTQVGLGNPIVTDLCDPNCTVTNNAPKTFPLGITKVTWTATDASGNKSTCIQTVTIVDTIPPVITCPADIVAEQTSRDGTPVNLGEPTVSDICDAKPTVTNNAPQVFPLGITLVTWTATDTSGNQSICIQAVTIVDTTPPKINSVTASPNELAPTPCIGLMKEVNLSVDASDICDAKPISRIIKVTSDQDCAIWSSPDWIINGDLSVFLRAETSFLSNRIYSITVECTDASGNSSTASTQVEVGFLMGGGRFFSGSNSRNTSRFSRSRLRANN